LQVILAMAPRSNATSNVRTKTNGEGRFTFPPLPDKSILELSQTFKLLGDESRLRILLHLARNRELHVTDLCSLIKQSQPAVSHHLALLRVAGIIESRRQGKHNFYRVSARFFNEALRRILAAGGTVPHRVRFENFVLTYAGR
jgi:ArsR family transcriptional regulator